MTFEQAVTRYQELRGLLHARKITQDQFNTGVSELRVEAEGKWWQLSPEGQWFWWDGAQWQAHHASAGQTSASSAQAATGNTATAYGGAQHTGISSGTGLEKVAKALQPLSGKSEGWWSVVSILGGGTSGALWYWYSTLDKRPDLITAGIMVLLPVLLAIFKKPLDKLLVPLMPLRQRVPRLVIIGMGIAAPYLMATFLYDVARISEYPFIRLSVFLGPLLSYMIIRTPNVATLQQAYAGNRIVSDLRQIGRR